MTYFAQRKGIANLPLHGGKAPRWLFERMVKLVREIIIVTIDEYGFDELLRRLADPFWFQALGCVLGFDWHSSGVTTTVCGAIKESIKGLELDLNFFAAGGKGKTSRKTPLQIEAYAPFLKINHEPLIYASRMSAKVDNTAIQDGYQLYQHTFFFTREGSWAVIQQGMNNLNRYARRYHWIGEKVESYVCEPENAICSQEKRTTLNLVAVESTQARSIITDIANNEKSDKIVEQLAKLKALNLPRHHHISAQDIHPERLTGIFDHIHDRNPENFESLLALKGVGPQTLRALSLISELIYNVPVSLRDPATFSFAHGGKDGYPFPVDRTAYDKSIMFLSEAIEQSRLSNRDKITSLKKLREWCSINEH